MQMEALAHMSATNNLNMNIKKIKSVGQLVLKQTSAMVPGIFKLTEDKTEGTIMQTNNVIDSLETMSLQELLREYSRWNESTVYV